VTLEACCGVGDLSAIGDCDPVYMGAIYRSSQQIVSEMNKVCHGCSRIEGRKAAGETPALLSYRKL
jgi:hypothetical protein